MRVIPRELVEIGTKEPRVIPSEAMRNRGI